MPRKRAAREGPSKGEQTRRRIVEHAAALFNVHGVAGASMADVTEAAGLEKGGVYNHFASKDELAHEAFDYASSLVLARLQNAADRASTPLGRLRAMIGVFRGLREQPYLSGGCPLLNSAIESDDTDPRMRDRVRGVMRALHGRFVTDLRDAIAGGELERVDAAAFASTAVAALEGAVMLSQLFRDASYLGAVAGHLESWLDERASVRDGLS